jgi:hypothetical protein
MEYRKSAWKTPELISAWNVRGIRLKPAHGGVPYDDNADPR